MSNYRFIIILTVINIIVPCSATFAQEGGFVPLVPDLPLVEKATNLPSLLQAFFGISVGVAAVLAVIMITIGGFQYMTTDSVFAMSGARERIANAIIGLLIVLLCVLVLRTINPDLVNLDPFRSLTIETTVGSNLTAKHTTS